MSDEIAIEELEELLKHGNASLMKLPWTPEEDAVLMKYYNKVPVRLIAQHIEGRTINAVQNRAVRLGLTGRQ